MNRFLALALCSALLTGSGFASAGKDASLPGGVQSGIKIERFTTSGKEGAKWAAEAIRGAKKDVTAEIFGLNDKKVVAAFSEKTQSPKVTVRAHTDPENIVQKNIQKLIAGGADFRPSGGNGIRDGHYDRDLNPNKVHAKAIHVDNKSWLSTASLKREAGSNSLDATAIVSGKGALAARAITEAAFRGDTKGLRDAADNGLRRGVLVNNAAAGITHYTDTERAFIRAAKSSLVISNKAVESKLYAKELSAATARGVKIILFTHDEKMSGKADKALSPKIQRAGDPFGVLHGNMLIVDNKMGIFGSAHATNRAQGEGSARLSHEMGYVVTNKEALDKMRTSILAFVPKDKLNM